MKYKILFTFCFLPLFLFAQQNEKTIAILDFEPKGDMADEEREALSKMVEQLFMQTAYWKIVDRKSIENIQKIRELQKDDAFVDAKNLAEQGKAVGAEFLLIGETYDFKQRVSPYESFDEKTGYTERGIKAITRVNFSIRLIKTETGEVMGTLNLNKESKIYQALQAPPSPVQVKNLKAQGLAKIHRKHLTKIHNWLQDITPSQAFVLEVLSGKSKAKEVLIGGYYSSKGREYLKVFEQTYEEVDGEQLLREELIAYIRVRKLEDNGFAVCSVDGGGKDLVKKLAAGAKLACRSKDENSLQLLIDDIGY